MADSAPQSQLTQTSAPTHIFHPTLLLRRATDAAVRKLDWPSRFLQIVDSPQLRSNDARAGVNMGADSSAGAGGCAC